jgi:hypothetical protein
VLFAVLGPLSRGWRALRLILLIWSVLIVARTYCEPPVLGSVLGVLPGIRLAVVSLAVLGLTAVAAYPLASALGTKFVHRR